MPNLSLLDLTIGYPHVPNPQANPGVAPATYPEDHYNLSLWTKNVPPSPMHYHLRAFPLAQIPLGDYRGGGDATEEEKLAFDGWLRARWQEKDELMKGFYEKGEFVAGQDGKVEWQVGLRHWWENAEAFSYGVPVVILWFVVPWALTFLASLAGWFFVGKGQISLGQGEL